MTVSAQSLADFNTVNYRLQQERCNCMNAWNVVFRRNEHICPILTELEQHHELFRLCNVFTPAMTQLEFDERYALFQVQKRKFDSYYRRVKLEFTFDN